MKLGKVHKESEIHLLGYCMQIRISGRRIMGNAVINGEPNNIND